MSTYKVKPGEEGTIHVRLSRKSFDPITGKRLQEPYIQKFTLAEFRKAEKNLYHLGFELEFLHDPREKKTDVPKQMEKDELSIARREYEQEFGKPAHNQKSAETLRAEIAEKQEYDSVLKRWQEVMKVKVVPSISKDDMLEDIRAVARKEKTVAELQAEGKEAIEKAAKEKAKDRAKRQSPDTPEHSPRVKQEEEKEETSE